MKTEEVIIQAKEIITTNGACPIIAYKDCSRCILYTEEESCHKDSDECVILAKSILFDNEISIKDLWKAKQKKIKTKLIRAMKAKLIELDNNINLC